jgi:hypothetical protein
MDIHNKDSSIGRDRLFIDQQTRFVMIIIKTVFSRLKSVPLVASLVTLSKVKKGSPLVEV